jgi:hypothetical protein
MFLSYIMNTFIKANYLLGYYEITVLTYTGSPKKLINFTLQFISKQKCKEKIKYFVTMN